MIEYLHSAIRATAGDDITIYACICEDGEDIKSGCGVMLHIGEEMKMFEGQYINGVWAFNIPADETAGLHGRYWYCLYKDGSTLCFKQPIYLM